jgi:hypothetical protein
LICLDGLLAILPGWGASRQQQHEQNQGCRLPLLWGADWHGLCSPSAAGRDTQRKGAPRRWTIVTQPGFANAIVTFPTAFSPLRGGLEGVVALAARMVVELVL